MNLMDKKYFSFLYEHESCVLVMRHHLQNFGMIQKMTHGQNKIMIKHSENGRQQKQACYVVKQKFDSHKHNHPTTRKCKNIF